MGFMQGLFKSFLNSLIISCLFALVGICLFIGTFPPSIKQVKQVFTEYKKLIKLKEQVMAQSGNLKTEDLADALQKEQQEQLRKLASSRGDKYLEQIEDEIPPFEKLAAMPVPTNPAEIPKAWQEQFYHLRSEVFRLNQRILELERHQKNKNP